MTPAKARERFELLQRNAQVTQKAVYTVSIDLAVKYGDRNTCYASKAEQRKYAQLQKTAKRHEEKFYAFLQTIAARDFSTGVPCAWLVSSLTYDDAVTRGALSAVPPAAWGYTAQDAARFAAELR